MASIHISCTGKPARIGLADRLGLPELSDAGGVVIMWDATESTAADKGKIEVRPFEPAFEDEPAGLEEFLATEADVSHAAGDASLSLSGLRGAVGLHLRNALRREVAEIIGLPAARVNLDMSLATLGVE